MQTIKSKSAKEFEYLLKAIAQGVEPDPVHFELLGSENYGIEIVTTKEAAARLDNAFRIEHRIKVEDWEISKGEDLPAEPGAFLTIWDNLQVDAEASVEPCMFQVPINGDERDVVRLRRKHDRYYIMYKPILVWDEVCSFDSVHEAIEKVMSIALGETHIHDYYESV